MYATFDMVNKGTGQLRLFKFEEGNCPATVSITGSTLAFDKLQENDGILFPPVTSGLTSSGNTLLWYGTQADLDALLDDTSSASTRCDGRTNRERMDHLKGTSCISGMPGCGTWTVTVRSSSQTPTQFLIANWKPLPDAWKASHDADEQP